MKEELYDDILEEKEEQADIKAILLNISSVGLGLLPPSLFA